MDEYYNVEQNSNRGRKTRNTISNIFAIVIIIIAIVVAIFFFNKNKNDII